MEKIVPQDLENKGLSPLHLYDGEGKVWLEDWVAEDGETVNMETLATALFEIMGDTRRSIPKYDRSEVDETVEKRLFLVKKQKEIDRHYASLHASRDRGSKTVQKTIRKVHKGGVSFKGKKKIRVKSYEDKIWDREWKRRVPSPDLEDTIRIIKKDLDNGAAFLVCTKREVVKNRINPLSKFSTKVPKWQQKNVLEQVYSSLDEARQNLKYQATIDNKVILDTDKNQILGNLRLLTFGELLDGAINRDLNKLMIKDYGRSAGSNGSSVSLNGTLYKSKEEQQRWTNGDGSPFFAPYIYDPKTKYYILWIPKHIPSFYLDKDDRSKLFSFESKGFSEKKPVQDPIYSCFVYYHQRLDSSIWGADFFSRSLKRSTGKGNGRGRADRASESTYLWSGEESFAFAMGLDLEKECGGLESDVAPLYYKAVNDFKDFEITYGKAYWNEITNKKNNPVSTQPVIFTNKAKSFIPEYLRKKQKGDWNFYFSSDKKPFDTQGKLLKHQEEKERESAGSVMRKAFSEMEIDSGETDLGSATQFGKWLLENDEDARDFWVDSQQDLEEFPGFSLSKSTLIELKNTLRADQEWCHLFGHGDGGNEVYENFVAGSEHCNTEQLAIEMGQRDGKFGDLYAKITAYLLPNSGAQKLIISVLDQKFVVELEGFVGLTEEEALERIDLALDKSENTLDDPLIDLLPSDGKPALGIPSLSEYAEFSFDQKKYVRKKIMGRLKAIRFQPFPLGYLIRYRIIYRPNEDSFKKIFDYNFFAQGESFNEHEFDILKETVKRLTYEAVGDGDIYEGMITDLIAKRNSKELEPRDFTYRLPPVDMETSAPQS